MKTRVISGAVLFGILLSTLSVGGWYLFFFCLAASLIGMFELFRVYEMQFTPAAFVSYAGAVALYFVMRSHLPVTIEMFIIVLTLLVILGFYVFTYPRIHADQVMVAVFALIYAALMLTYIYRLRAMPGGAALVWLVFLGSWVNDTCAYFTGYFFGKHKMAPVLSPKKTWEGAAGGITGATVIGLIYGIIMANTGLHIRGNIIAIFTLTGALGSVCGIVGDLAASAIKRNKDIKDYGRLIPGHGGILDRFDSVILVAPVVYWSVCFMSVH